MRKLLLAAFAALLAAGSAGAIINGEPDGNRHPYVAVIGFLNPDGTRGPLCTGTLVSPRVVVTAGHCTYRSPAAFVWFDEQFDPRKPPAAIGQPVTHPDFNPELTLPNTGDLGVVLLGNPVQMPVYGALPTDGYLENLGKKRGHELGVSIVGYGVQSLDPFVPPGTRMLGHARIHNLSSSFVRDYGVKISGVNGSGRAGNCSGDSGGPVLHDDSNLIVGVYSFGNVDTCTGANYAYRLDTPSARAFLGQFVPLP